MYEADANDARYVLGLTQLVILKLIQKDPEKAYGKAVMQKMSAHHMIDGSQVYVSIQRLMKRGFLIPKGSQQKRVGKGGRPIKLYKVTRDGELAIGLAEALLGICDDLRRDESHLKQK